MSTTLPASASGPSPPAVDERIPSLPTEVKSSILSFLPYVASPSLLYSLCLTLRALREQCTPILYRTITLTSTNAELLFRGFSQRFGPPDFVIPPTKDPVYETWDDPVQRDAHPLGRRMHLLRMVERLIISTGDAFLIAAEAAELRPRIGDPIVLFPSVCFLSLGERAGAPRECCAEDVAHHFRESAKDRALLEIVESTLGVSQLALHNAHPCDFLRSLGEYDSALPVNELTVYLKKAEDVVTEKYDVPHTHEACVRRFMRAFFNMDDEEVYIFAGADKDNLSGIDFLNLAVPPGLTEQQSEELLEDELLESASDENPWHQWIEENHSTVKKGSRVCECCLQS
ncbi:hypothetical protein IAT38_003257 [Cryptococcus sp. DSM 104549]